MKQTDHPPSNTITRFAPSPTGLLHLGHAYSALFANQQAQKAHGKMLLRIEDIDFGRCRREFIDAIYEDLAWLGLAWETPVRLQSEHMDDYRKALDQLEGLGILYPCFCTRKDIAAEIHAAGGAPHLTQTGPDGPLYPGTCKRLSQSQREMRIGTNEPFALRLDMDKARKIAGPLVWYDAQKGPQDVHPDLFGDVVLARKDTPTSYHLSVTVDDHLQGVTLVTRGDDLFAATHIHRLLQALLGLDTPQYQHHPLVKADDGRRLAKRDKAETIQDLRAKGLSPDDVRRQIGLNQL